MRKKYIIISIIIILALIVLLFFLKDSPKKHNLHNVESLKLNRYNFNITHTIYEQSKITTIVDLINTSEKITNIPYMPYIYMIEATTKTSTYKFYLFEYERNYYIKDNHSVIWKVNQQLYTILQDMFIKKD